MGSARSSLWHVVHVERQALLEDLSALEAAQWETPSLCDGWTIRDVAAHLAATAVLSRTGFAREFIRARFSVDRIVDRQVAIAREHDVSQVLDTLRSSVNCTASPPLPAITRIIEIVVHGEDIRRRLGIRHDYPTTGIAEAVAYLAGDRASGGRRRLKGLT